MPVVTASSGHLVSEDTKCYRIAGRTPKGRLDELAADYASMRQMLFGSYPSIDEIVAYMAELKETINGLS